MGGLSYETAEYLTQINDAAAYAIRIAFAVYTLAPLGQGDFATTKYRSIVLGSLFLISSALSIAQSLLAFRVKWAGRQALKLRSLHDLAENTLGVDLDVNVEVVLSTLESAALFTALGLVAWYSRRRRAGVA